MTQTGNYIRTATIAGPGWSISVQLDAEDDDALVRARRALWDIAGAPHECPSCYSNLIDRHN